MEGLFVTVLNMSITASWILLWILLLRLALKRSPKILTRVLWLVLLFRMLCPVSFSLPLSFLGGGLPAWQAPAPVDGRMEYISSAAVSEAPRETHDAQEPSPVTQPDGAEQAAAPMQTLWRIAGFLWLGGAAGMLLYGLGSFLRLRHRVSTAVHTGGAVYETDRIASPFVLGVWRHRIYLPLDLDPEDRGFILLHEQAHIRRHDPWIKLAAFFALSVHWFNPLLWWALALMSRDMEMDCDEAVLRSLGPERRADYSQSLLRLAGPGRGLASAGLAFGEGGIPARIRRILRYRRPVFWGVALAAAAAAAAAFLALGNPPAAAPVPDDSQVLAVLDVQVRAVLEDRLEAVRSDEAGEETVYIAWSEDAVLPELAPGDWIQVGYTTVQESSPPVYLAEDISRITRYPAYLTLYDGSHQPLETTTLADKETVDALMALLPDRGSRLSASDLPTDASGRYLRIQAGENNLERIYYVYAGEPDAQGNPTYYVEKPYQFIAAIDAGLWLEIFDFLQAGAPLTWDALLSLTESRGEALDWQDFQGYAYEETGSGLYIRAYPIDDQYVVLVGGANPQERAMYVTLADRSSQDRGMDLRTEDLRAFMGWEPDATDLP